MGVGLVVAGLTGYGFLAVSARAVGPARYAPLSALWALVLIGGTGLFFPLEQEVARAVAARRARGETGGPVVKRAAAIAALVTVIVLVVIGALRGQVGELLDQQPLLVLGLALAVAGSAGQHLARGYLAGMSRFKEYGLLLGVEGFLRLLGSLALALGHVEQAGPYGVVLGMAPLLALLVVWRLPAELRQAGRQPPWAELSQAVGHLLAGSLLSQVLVNVGPVVVKALAPPGQEAAAGRFLASLVLARVPLFLFAAVQAALLPRLSRLAAIGGVRELTASLVRVLAAVVAACSVAILAAATIGPVAVQVLFGPDFALGGADLAVLAGATGAYIVALVNSQGLIALVGHRQATLGWLGGVVAFVAVTLPSAEVVIRAERGMLAGAVAAAALHGGLLVRRVRALTASPGGDQGRIPIITSVPLEP